MVRAPALASKDRRPRCGVPLRSSAPTGAARRRSTRIATRIASAPSTSAVTATAVSNGAELTAPNALSSNHTTPKIALARMSSTTPRKQPMRRAMRLPCRRQFGPPPHGPAPRLPATRADGAPPLPHGGPGSCVAVDEAVPDPEHRLEMSRRPGIPFDLSAQVLDVRVDRPLVRTRRRRRGPRPAAVHG